MKLVSTMGWVPDVVAYPIRVLKPEEVVVFVGAVEGEDRKRMRDAMDYLKNEVMRRIEFVEVNPLDMGDCIEKMRPHLDDDTVVNITGGTKIMAFTLALLATLRFEDGPNKNKLSRELPIIYVKTDSAGMKIERFPLQMGVPVFNPRGNSTAALILKILLDSTGGEMSSPEIKEVMESIYGKKVEGSTFSEAKRMLLNANLISERTEKNKKTQRNMKVLKVHAAARILMGGESR